MLSVAKISAGPRAAVYYMEQVASGAEDYYAGEGEAPGVWVGSGAAAAGLEGEVKAGELEHLLAGNGLRQQVRDGAVAGFDLTFRAPKSVSVLWGIADPAVSGQLGEAHDAGVAAALTYLEREACRARRGKGGVVQVPGGGFVAAAFRHRSSRAGDPLLHTHVVTGNLTQGPDGRWTALDARHLYRHAKTAGFVYQAELRREVTLRLGLTWGPVERGTADIRGVDRPVVEHFSQRRREILDHMAEHGGRSTASAKVAALETRRAKQTIRGDRLRELWRARAAEHGLPTPAVEQLLRRSTTIVPAASPVRRETLTRDSSVFGRPELLQALAEQQPAGARLADLERLANATLTSPDVVPLPKGPVPAGLSEVRFTTVEQLHLEHDLLERARRGQGMQAGKLSDSTVQRVLAARSLSREQEKVVTELCSRGDSVSIVRAAAGTGKTFVLDAAREAWQRERREVHGTALSARAALELSDQAGIPSMTIAQLLARLDQGTPLPHNGVLVVDEAGMVGTRALAQLAEAAQASRTKLVLVGDDRQLPEIQAGGAFHALAEHLPTSTLREVRRQNEAWDRQALDALRSGEVEQWARAYREHGRITVGATATTTRTALVHDWSQASGDRLMVAARREDVSALNDQARALLQDRGRLPADELKIAGRSFSRGDRIIGARNDRRTGILNGQRGTVLAVDAPARALDVRLDDGSRIRVPTEYLSAGHLEHGYAITAHRAQGATVDRTFVLGSEELYREWGYTALSRHREEARFYVARGDLHPNPELPPSHDPLVAAISQLLQRSNAKTLALDALPQFAREELEDARRQLHQQLTWAPPPRRIPRVEKRDIDDATRRLVNARATEQRLLAQRGRLGWRDRKTRADIDQRLEHNTAEQRSLARQLDAATSTQTLAGRDDQSWLGDHGSQAAQLLAVDAELRSRDAADTHAARRLDTLDRHPLDPPTRSHDDLDLDLGM